MILENTMNNIRPLSAEAMKACRERWNHIAKPINGLGKLEDILVKIAGITGSSSINLDKKALIVMCADNGVVEEGVTQTGQEVTAIVTNNMATGNTTSCIFTQCAGADIFPIDVGVAAETLIQDKKISFGTKNIAKEQAMTRAQALQAISVGIEKAEQLKTEGYSLIAAGEMGIGNTTTSSAVAAVLLNCPVEAVTGKGAGLTDEGLVKKIQVIRQAIELHKPLSTDPVDVLSKVGGYDIAAITGIYLGAAAAGIPVVVDGFIAATAAICAVRMAPETGSYLIGSHLSKEPGSGILLEELELDTCLSMDMRLGEGTGAVMMFPLLDMAAAVYNKMPTFQQSNIEDYKVFK